MEYKGLHNKTKNELMQMLADLKNKLSKMRFDLAGKKLKDTSQIKKVKKEIAKTMTALNSQI